MKLHLQFLAAASLVAVFSTVGAAGIQGPRGDELRGEQPWVKEIREGVDAILGPSSELTYFYMNTKAGPRRRAEEGAGGVCAVPVTRIPTA